MFDSKKRQRIKKQELYKSIENKYRNKKLASDGEQLEIDTTGLSSSMANNILSSMHTIPTMKVCTKSEFDNMNDKSNKNTFYNGEMLFVSDTNETYVYYDNQWIGIESVDDKDNDTEPPKKIVYDTLKLLGFNCPSCGGVDYEELENNKIKCTHCDKIFKYKLE